MNLEIPPSEPLTPDALYEAFEALKESADWERKHPHGASAENPHVVHPKTRERLRREGGWAYCGSCMNWFWTDPPA